MKRCLSFLLVLLLVLSCIGLSTGALADSNKVNLSIVTKDLYTGKALGSVHLDIWKITKVSNGTTEECVKEVKTNSKGQIVVSLKPGTYRINVFDAPDGYSLYTTTDITLKADMSVTVNVLPLFTCKIKVLDRNGNPVSGAEVNICRSSAKTNKNGIATVKKVEYGKNTVQVVMTDNGKRFVAYEQQKNLKTSANQTISRTINLLPRSKWTQIVTQRIASKPIIYLYSKDEKDVHIKLGKPENITSSYPEYVAETGWNVTVHTDSMLTDLNSGKVLYSLYWEGLNKDIEMQDTGFIVAGSDTVRFLEEKLAYLGLTERETEEFIIYWLPRLQNNAYNYIRFATEDEINECMPLAITPAPDKTVRIWMEYTSLEEKPEGISEQELIRVNRDELSNLDFYVVEWGGTEF